MVGKSGAQGRTRATGEQSDPRTPEAMFASLRRDLAEIETGPPRRGFGSDALKVDGKIFAALSGGKLLLKLPALRVATLIASGDGEPFSSGVRLMKQWALANAGNLAAWPALAREAKAFVAGAADPINAPPSDRPRR
jgi:hypothetical protein